MRMESEAMTARRMEEANKRGERNPDLRPD
jgi:hypothetical protein